MDPANRSQLAPRAVLVRRLADEAGFAMVGIAPARPSDHADVVRQWIRDSRHGEMGYLARTIETRLDPGRWVEGARSVICVADFYPDRAGYGGPGQAAGGARLPTLDQGGQPETARPTPQGRIARYAWGDDYHKVMKRRLYRMTDALATRFEDQVFRVAVDTAPVLERQHAQLAGLGWCGKHTLLIHPVYGSWMLLGQIITTLAIQTSDQANYPGPTVPPVDHCGSCTRCIDACPTRCITPHAVDASRCISYLTLEHRTAIDPALHPAMGDWIAGCDVCQQVCPFNQSSGDDHGQAPQRPMADRTPAIRPEYKPRPPAPAIALLSILGWTAEDRRTAFAGSALKRIKLDMAKRNALIAAGNALRQHADAALRSRIESIASDAREPPMVRQTARQVLDRLGR